LNANVVVEDKEFVVLVGPSGCGKSTTLRMIAGLEEVTSGDIYIDGICVNDMPPKDRDIAMVFQNYALYPHMTVYKNMAFGLMLRRYPKKEIDRRVRDAAEILGITELLDRRPKALSGGQRQRVAVGRAIVRQPKVFLFDEPLSNLDARLRVQMRAEISKLHRRLQSTMIYVTHDQTEAMTMGDRIVLMSDGDIQQIAPPLELYHHPANRFVAEFIGSPPMNILDGRIVEDKGNLFFVGAAGDVRLLVPPARSARLASRAGKTVAMGIRPEHLLENDLQRETPGRSIKALVDMAEPMGSETNLYLNLEGKTLVARVRAENIRPHEEHVFDIEMEQAHFFDIETQLPLC